MFWTKTYQRHLGIATAAVFSVQMLAIVFCFTGQALATPATMQPTMAASCPMDMDVPVQTTDDKVPCAYCDLPDSGAITSSLGSLSVDLPLVAILPSMWAVQVVSGPNTRIHHIVQAQAPPHSAALLYQTSLRIRL